MNHDPNHNSQTVQEKLALPVLSPSEQQVYVDYWHRFKRAKTTPLEESAARPPPAEPALPAETQLDTEHVINLTAESPVYVDNQLGDPTIRQPDFESDLNEAMDEHVKKEMEKEDKIQSFLMKMSEHELEKQATLAQEHRLFPEFRDKLAADLGCETVDELDPFGEGDLMEELVSWHMFLSVNSPNDAIIAPKARPPALRRSIRPPVAKPHDHEGHLGTGSNHN